MMRAIFLSIALLCGGAASAEMPAMDDDGWYRWQIANPESGQMYCWMGHNMYSTKCGELGAANKIYVYARNRNGDIVDIRLRSERCGVEVEDEFRDLGL